MRDLHALDKYRDRNFEREYYGCNGGGWEHVSVSSANRKRTTAPTWEEMCEIKRMFFQEDETVVEYHPAKADYVNLHPMCLHLWRPTSQEMPKTPKKFV